MNRFIIDDLSFAVRESPRRRSIGIAVERDNSLTLLTPPDTSPDVLRGIVLSKRTWIYQKLAARSLLAPAPAPKAFLDGQGFYYLGRSYRLLLSTVPDGPPLQLRRGRFILRENTLPVARNHFVAWYKAHLAPWAAAEIATVAPRLEVSPADVQIRDIGNRWGSCTPAGRILLHWRVALLPPRMITYVIAHELAHLREPHHDTRFWTLLSRLLPDYRDRKRWLAEHGATYTI